MRYAAPHTVGGAEVCCFHQYHLFWRSRFGEYLISQGLPERSIDQCDDATRCFGCTAMVFAVEIEH